MTEGTTRGASVSKRLPDSTFVAYLTDAGHSKIIFAGLRPEMLASNVVLAVVPHRLNWHFAVGTKVDRTWWSRETRGFPASVVK